MKSTPPPIGAHVLQVDSAAHSSGIRAPAANKSRPPCAHSQRSRGRAGSPPPVLHAAAVLRATALQSRSAAGRAGCGGRSSAGIAPRQRNVIVLINTPSRDQPVILAARSAPRICQSRAPGAVAGIENPNARTLHRIHKLAMWSRFRPCAAENSGSPTRQNHRALCWMTAICCPGCTRMPSKSKDGWSS